jgi:hypothetical protein
MTAPVGCKYVASLKLAVDAAYAIEITVGIFGFLRKLLPTSHLGSALQMRDR